MCKRSCACGCVYRERVFICARGHYLGIRHRCWCCIRRCCLGITHRCACIGRRRVCTKRCCMCVNEAYLSEIIIHLFVCKVSFLYKIS